MNDDFRSLDNVMSKFNVWRRDFDEDYGNAYGDLSLTGVFELYVRYELISWDPFAVRILGICFTSTAVL